MKEKLKAFVKSQPLLVKLFRTVNQGHIFTPTITKSIKGSGNKLEFDPSVLFVDCKITINGNNNEVIIKDTCMLVNVAFTITGNNNKIVIERNVSYAEGGACWIEDEHCEIHVGENTSFISTDIAVTEPFSKVIIGNNCLFAFDVDIRTGDSHSILDLHTRKRINYAQDVVIGNHVWVGAHVSILKGTNIADDCIVATRALVTKKFEKEHVLIGGSPAVIIKEDVTWEQERIYEK